MEMALPTEMIEEIGLRTRPADLGRFCAIDKQHAEVCRSDYFWAQKYKRDFGTRVYRVAKNTGFFIPQPGSAEDPFTNWRERYQEMYLQQEQPCSPRLRYYRDPYKCYIQAIEQEQPEENVLYFQSKLRTMPKFEPALLVYYMRRNDREKLIQLLRENKITVFTFYYYLNWPYWDNPLWRELLQGAIDANQLAISLDEFILYLRYIQWFRKLEDKNIILRSNGRLDRPRTRELVPQSEIDVVIPELEQELGPYLTESEFIELQEIMHREPRFEEKLTARYYPMVR